MGDRRKTLSCTVVGLLAVVAIIRSCRCCSWRWDWWEAWAYAVIFILGFVVSRDSRRASRPDRRTRPLRATRAHQTVGPASGSSRRLRLWPRPAGGRTRCAVGRVGVVQPPGEDPLAGRAPGRLRLGVVRLARKPLLLRRRAYPIRTRPSRGLERPVPLDATSRLRRSAAGPWLPVYLDSRWAFLPAVLLTVILVVRTALEDRVLHDELAGYREYAKRVRYRLLPGVW